MTTRLRRALHKLAGAGASAIAVVAVIPATAAATTTTLNFDSTPVGTALTTVATPVGDVTFPGGPIVFAPPAGTTSSAPNALHKAQPCSSAPTTCYIQEFDFASPLSAVSLRLGSEDEQTGEFPPPFELVAYDSAGNRVGNSDPNALLGTEGYIPITRSVSASSLHTDIVRAVLSVGVTDTYTVPNSAYTVRVNVDDLTLTNTSLPPPPPPTVAITAPTDGHTFTQAADVRVSGHVNAASGVTRFCLTASTDTTFPALCTDRGAIDTAGNFTNLVVRGLQTGANTITAWVQDGNVREASTSVNVNVAAVNLSATNLEVTQDIQSQLPSVTAPAGGPRTATYRGVPLAAGRRTVVRFWTGADLGGGLNPLSTVRAQLIGTRNGVSLGVPLNSIEGGVTIDGTKSVLPPGPTVGQWSDPTSQSFTFSLPPTWTTGTISLQAVVNPAGSFPLVTECATCSADNAITLGGVAFTPVRGETIVPIEMVTRAADGHINHPNAVFGSAQAMMPFNVSVVPYAGAIDISDGVGVSDRATRQSLAMGKLFNWIDHNGNPSGHVVAMSSGQDLGLTSTQLVCCDSHLGIDTAAQVSDTRPLTAVAHEFGHELGLSHAGYNCPGDPAGSGGAVHWPGPDMGNLNGVGIDTRSGSGGAGAPFRVYPLVDATGAPAPDFDFMSYCEDTGEGPTTWISVTNWTQLLHDYATGAAGARALRTSPAPAASTSASAAKAPGVLGGTPHRVSGHGPALRIVALIPGNGGKTQILGVEPLTGATVAPAASSPITIRLLGAGGNVVSSTKVPVTIGHMDGNGPFMAVDAVVRAPGAAQLQLVSGRKIIGRRTRPAHRPRVKLLSPKPSAKILGTGSTLVRWHVSVPGHPKLTTAIQYSTNGRTWHSVVTGTHATSYRLPNELLTHSTRGRLRIQVSDGWNLATATSGKLRVAGPPSRAAITAPVPGARLAADATVVVSGSALDDRGAPIPASRLRWYDAGRYVGSGPRLTVRGLVPGRHRLRLVTVADGRRGGASIPLRVTAARPSFSQLRVVRRGRSAVVTAASTMAGTITIGGASRWLGARPRTIVVAAAPRRLRIALHTRAGTLHVVRELG